MTYLLDVNVLIAMAWPTHVHHRFARSWFENVGQSSWATCPITQIGFVRISSNAKFVDGAVQPIQAIELLTRATALAGHEFWPDDVSLAVDNEFLRGAIGHHQITDAYLCTLAQHHGGKLATLDVRLASLIADKDQQARLIEEIPS